MEKKKNLLEIKLLQKLEKSQLKVMINQKDIFNTDLNSDQLIVPNSFFRETVSHFQESGGETVIKSGSNKGNNYVSKEGEGTKTTRVVPKMESKGIRLMLGNIRNIIQKSNRNKVRILEDISLDKNVGITLLSKTYLNGDIKDAHIDMNNFYHHRVDRVDRFHGRVIIYLRKDIDSTKVLEYSDSQI